jgi:nucleoside-diphosphate-sugar epimerase
MNILLTGGTGYLGSHLAKACVEQGHHVAIFKRSFSDTRRIKDLLADVDVYDLDLCDIEQAFRDRKIDAIVHTATCYGRQGERVEAILKANVEFPAMLLDVASFFGVSCFINTDTCLDKFLNAYSLSKKQFSEWGRIFSRQGGICFLNVVLEHFYGPNEDDSKFVSFVIKKLLDHASAIEFTAGEQTRDFIYIEDVVQAYLLLLAKVERFDVNFMEFELGSGKEVTIRSLVEVIHRLTASDTILKFGVLPYREGEKMHSCADIQSLLNLGWTPKVLLENGLSKTIAAEIVDMHR